MNRRESGIRKSIQASLCLFLILLSGCGTLINSEPDWVKNPQSIYPDNKFLVSIGEGDTRQGAENAAAANLSRIFESRIHSDERLTDSVTETQDNFSRTTDLQTDISVLSSQTLLNIQHAEAWTDKTGRCHAVAYLNRRETAAIYRPKIEEYNRQISALLADAHAETDLLRRYALLRSALIAAQENEQLLNQLKIIHPTSASASAPSASLISIRNAAIESARRIRVDIQLKGDPAGRMSNTLKELITRYGFTIGNPAVLTVTGETTLEDTGKRTAGLAFFRYTLAIQFSDAQGTGLVSITDRGREAVTDPKEAPTRCHRTMAAKLKTDGVQALDDYFNTLSRSR